MAFSADASYNFSPGFGSCQGVLVVNGSLGLISTQKSAMYGFIHTQFPPLNVGLNSPVGAFIPAETGSSKAAYKSGLIGLDFFIFQGVEQ